MTSLYNLAGRFCGVRLDDGRCVPPDPANADWATFIAANPSWDTSDKLPLSAADITAGQRSDADALLSSPAGVSKLQRAVVLVTLDQVNVLLDFDSQLKAAVAAATTLADLKTRVAAITTNLTPRTKAQLIVAVSAKIDAGDAD